MRNLTVGLILGVFTSMALTGTESFAATGREGHGGAGWVCRDSSNDITWVKLVDLFEAKNQFGLTLDSFTNQPVQAQLAAIENKIQSIDPNVLSIYQADMKGVTDGIVSSSDIAIVKIQDANPVVTPASELCPGGTIDYEQIANYTPDGHVILAQLLFDRLSSADQAALYVHETVYQMYRDVLAATNSDLAREAVGYLFSNTPTTQYPYSFLGNDPKTFVASAFASANSLSWRFDLVSLTPGEIVKNETSFNSVFGGLLTGNSTELGTTAISVVADPEALTLLYTISWTSETSQLVVETAYSSQCQSLPSDFDNLKMQVWEQTIPPINPNDPAWSEIAYEHTWGTEFYCVVSSVTVSSSINISGTTEITPYVSGSYSLEVGIDPFNGNLSHVEVVSSLDKSGGFDESLTSQTPSY